METVLHPLTGLQPSRNGFSVPIDTDGEWGAKMYDLSALLRGGREGGFERSISEEIRKTVPELRASGSFVLWEIFTRDITAGTPAAGGSST
jgi:hypothetical protein